MVVATALLAAAGARDGHGGAGAITLNRVGGQVKAAPAKMIGQLFTAA